MTIQNKIKYFAINYLIVLSQILLLTKVQFMFYIYKCLVNYI